MRLLLALLAASYLVTGCATEPKPYGGVDFSEYEQPKPKRDWNAIGDAFLEGSKAMQPASAPAPKICNVESMGGGVYQTTCR